MNFMFCLGTHSQPATAVAIWKMLRKKGCVPSALTQNVKDFLASPEIENIFENSDFLILLAQAQATVR